MLSCSCGWDDVEWWYEDSGVVAPLATKRMRRCCSCKDRIAVGDDCVRFRRWRSVDYFNDHPVVASIYGDEYPLTPWYMCDRCAGLYESLDSLGYCDLLGQDMRELCREYAQMQRDGGVFKGEMVMTQRSAQQ